MPKLHTDMRFIRNITSAAMPTRCNPGTADAPAPLAGVTRACCVRVQSASRLGVGGRVDAVHVGTQGLERLQYIVGHGGNSAGSAGVPPAVPNAGGTPALPADRSFPQQLFYCFQPVHQPRPGG